MGKFAERTKVDVSKSRTDIDKILAKHGATHFMSGISPLRAVVAFEMNGRRLRFDLPLPDSSKAGAEQEERRRWRSLLLVIKAKLEAVETGVVTFDQEFLAHIVLPNNQTYGEFAIPQIALTYQSKTMPPLLPGPKETAAKARVYKAAVDQLAESMAGGAWQDGPAPKDGSWILGLFHGRPHVVAYDSWEVGGETLPDGSGSPPDGYESGWCLAGDNLHVMDKDEPEKWARIIHPNRHMPASWDGPGNRS